LERRTSRAGKDSIDHVPGGHDDVANAAAGAAVIAVQAAARPSVRPVMPGVWSKQSGWISDPCPTTNESTTAAFYDYHANGGGSWPGSNRSGYDW